MGSYIGKLVNRRLREKARSVITFLDNLKLELMEMQEYLAKKHSSNSWEEVACEWMFDNRHRWELWVPKDTTCFSGFGLIDVAGNTVASRENAVGCGLCAPGTISSAVLDDIGRTFTCTSCAAGTYQEQAGETLCVSCPAGRISTETGRSQCEACPPGTYANSSGSDRCQVCGSGSAQWTTSRLTEVRGVQQWLQTEAAVSESFCHCIPGWFLEEQTCQECLEGASCPGSNDVELKPGYFSFGYDRGSVYRCKGDGLACPGGVPGTCAGGRDNSSVACSACLPGLHPTAEGCLPCKGQDCRGPGHEPFLTLIRLFSIVSLDEFIHSLNAISCVTRFSHTWQFLFQTVAVPVAFMTGPVLMHLGHLYMSNRRMKREKKSKMAFKLHVLGETFGFLCLLFFIGLCTAVLEPFECVKHPNGLSTMRTAIDVVCNFRDEHLSLALVASFLTLLPIGFFSVCAWIVLRELPKRIHSMDVKFVRSCSFLVSRFRPGNQAFAVFLLMRNAVVALAPVLPSSDAGCFVVFAMLCVNLSLTAMFQPWLSPLASYIDMLANFCFLTIILYGSFFVDNVHGPSGMIVCSAVLCGILLIFFSLTVQALVETWSRKRTKRYDYFLTHHKKPCGCLARWMKLELQQRGRSVFLDSDDLSNLSHIFSTLAYNVDVLVVLASPGIFKRKWCLGEVVTAHLQNVETIVVALPKFSFPDDIFIDAVDNVVGDMNDLAAYGMGRSDVKESLRKLKDQKTVTLPQGFQGSDMAEIIRQLCPQEPGGARLGSYLADSGPSCLILANPDDMEAQAAAHVLRTWMFPQLLQRRIAGPFVLSPSERLVSVASEDVKFLIVLCTKGCLQVPTMMSWLIQAHQSSRCCRTLPVIADTCHCFQ
eukprot:Skav230083  [mRNA]  locus=scaffold2569:306570:309736:- [translate_table: standard]